MAKNLPATKQTPQDALMEAFKIDLTNITPYLASLLGKDKVGRFQRMAQLAVLRNPDLLNATKKSLLLALLWCAQKNLEPGVEDGAWLIPFKVKGGLTVVPIPGYKGLVNRAVEIGAALSVDPVGVYANDDFYYCFGLEPDLRHTPPKLGDPRGELIGAYVTITLPNREKKFRVMDRAQIEEHRNAGAAWRNAPDTGPWKEWEEAMFLKTVIKQGLKTVPMKADLRDLLSEDGMIEAGASVAALAGAAAAETGTDLPADLKGGDEELEMAQEKLAATKADTSEFDALVAEEVGALPEDVARARMIHLDENIKIVAKNMKKTVPMAKNYLTENKMFYDYVNSKGEPKEGYWKRFLAWEADPARPWHEMGNEAGEGAAAISPADKLSFEDRKKTLVMAILKPPIPLADLELANLGEDITEENIADIEARVKAWTPPKKGK